MTEAKEIERGEVIRADGRRITIRLPRKDVCSACGLCLLARDSGGVFLETDNTIGARPGDRVDLEIPRRDPLAAAGLLFAVPLLALLAGAGAGYLLAGPAGLDPDGAGVLSGVIGLLAAFFLIRRRELRRREEKKENIRIIRLAPPAVPG